MLRFIHLIALLCACALVSANQLTVTVAAYNRATASGDDADQVTVSYIQHQSTPYKCRLSQGDTAVLCIEGLPAATLERVTLSMRSNKSSGAGWLDMRVGGSPVWQIADASFASDAWNGAYTDTYTSIAHSLNTASGTVLLTICATANSLYFEQLTLEYSPSAPMPHTVFLDGGAGDVSWLTEQAAGAGVVLPEPASVNAEWTALGWTDAPVSQQTEKPLYHASGSVYYPQTDITLYALYRSADGMQTLLPDTTRQEGEYIIAFGSVFMQMANGAVRNKAVPAAGCELAGDTLLTDYAPRSCRYQLTFDADSVEIRHTASSTWLGHDETVLTNKRSRWAWQRAKSNSLCLWFTGEKGAVCLMPKEETLALYPLASNDPAAIEHALLFDVAELPTEPQTIIYTSYPLSGVGLDEMETENAEKIMKDGRVLIRRNGHTYDLYGRLME